MKNQIFNKIISLSIQIVFLFIIIPADLFPEEKKNITETVNVMDFEVPVRVFLKKKLVDNLTKKDFLLYEDGKLQNINGFYITKKKIKINEDISQEEKRSDNKGRYFILVFRITEFNKQLKKGLDYFFEKLFRKNDQLLIFVNEKTFFINNLNNPDLIRKTIFKMLRDESKKAKFRLSSIFDKINTELSNMKFNQSLAGSMAQPAVEIIAFLERYIFILDNYRKKYLTPSVDDYYNFAKYLQKIDREKWVINFYQIEMFPKLKNSGEVMQNIKDLIGQLQSSNRGEDLFHSRTLSNLLMKINIALNATTDFPAEEISKLFYKVNTVFHSIFIRTTKTALSEDLEYKRVSTNLENSFRKITESTGGTLISSGNIKRSLEKITEKEDILYMLTYTPEEGKKVGKIRIKTKDPDYKVVYDNNIRDHYIKRYFRKKEEGIPAIKIETVDLKNRKLTVKIIDYFYRMENGRHLGKMKIHIRIVKNSGKIYFDEEKIIVADKKSFKITLGLNNMESGEYSIVVEALDLLTEKSDMKYSQQEYKY